MASFKNQHFLQRAYLGGFASANLPAKWKNTSAIWVLHKKTGVIRLKSTEKTASRSHYYSFVDNNGVLNPMIEKWFNPIENEFFRMRNHIREHIEEINLTRKASNLDPKYRRLLAEYVYIHIIRVPAIFDEIKRQANVLETRVAMKYGHEPNANYAQVMALQVMMGVGQTPGMNIVDALMKRTIDIEFFLRTRVSLATCDAPVIMYDESKSPGLAYDSTTIFFPLDSSIMIRFAEFGDQIKMVKQRDMTQAIHLANLVGTMAREEVYCRDTKVLKEIASYLRIEAKILDLPETEVL